MQHKEFRIKNINLASRFFALAFFVVIILLTGCIEEFSEDSTAVSSNQLRATVIKVKDGDSVILRYANGVEKEARLFGVDAPEYNQPYGRNSKRHLEKLVFKKTLLVKSYGEDRYKREIVLLTKHGERRSVNFEMINIGAAWVYQQYQQDKIWRNAEEDSRKKRLGLWKARQPIPPWEWRKK